MSYTKGPWMICKSKKDKHKEAIFIRHHKGFIGKVYGHEGEPVEANANLIASAPELLEACKKAREFIVNGVELGYITLPSMKGDTALDTLPIIEQAIAKAEGEEK